MNRRIKILILLIGLLFIAPQFPALGQETGFTIPTSTAKVRVPRDSDFPELIVNGDYFNPTGWVASRPLSAGFGQMRKEMDACMRMGYECFLLRVDWPSIEPVEGGMRLDTLQRVLSYADSIGLSLIVGLEFNIAPSWFVEKFPDTVTVTRYLDEEVDVVSGQHERNQLRGRLLLSEGRGIMGFLWPNEEGALQEELYYTEIRQFWEDMVKALYHQLKPHASFMAWAINTPAGPLGYPGGGIDGIVGISDYSDAKRDAYFKASGREIPNPLPRYSQGAPDSRAEWLDYSFYRITNRRNFIDFVGREIKTSDAYHPVFFFPGEILSYTRDNGYLAECEGLDWGYYIKRNYIDGVILPFQFSAQTYAKGYHPGKGDMVTLRAAIGAAIRHGKLPLVWVERSVDTPSVMDIRALSAHLKVMGAFALFSQPVRYTDSKRWSRALLREIEYGGVHKLLPPPRKRQPTRVAVLDFPFLLSKYYAEKDNLLINALVQLEVFYQAGIPYDLLDVNELIDNPHVLDNYRVVMPLAYQMFQSEFFDDPRVEVILDKFKEKNGRIYTPQPIKLKEFAEGGFSDMNFIEETRVEFVQFGCETNQVATSDVTIAVAEPYIFIYPHHFRYDGYIHAYIGRWSTSTFKVLHFVDVLNGGKLISDVFNKQLRMDLDMMGGHPYFYAETETVIDVLSQVHELKSVIAIRQTEQAMRRFVPVSLGVCFIMLLLLAFYSFHGQKDQIQQRALRIEKAMHLEEFDIVELERIRRNHYIQQLGSTDVVKRIVAASALGDMGEDAREALPVLRSLLEDEDPYFQKALREAISKIEGYG